MTEPAQKSPSIGVLGALSIGVGGIVGGGFFATFGLTIAGARGGTPVAFVIAGLIALATAYSYVGLTLRYPGPGGTNGFLRIAFGKGLVPASMSVLLVLSYVAIMSVYASAIASYSSAYLPVEARAFASHIIASGAIILFGLVNFAGGRLVTKLGVYFNVGKLAVLLLFIVAGFAIGSLDWSRLEPAQWSPMSGVIATGMLGFLAYEGFELIANSSDNIQNPRRTLPIAMLGSVGIAIIIYVLAFIVAIGHMSFDELLASRDFAVAAAGGKFLGSMGFGIMTVGAVLASASAINADFFGASKLPVMLATHTELPSVFESKMRGAPVASLLAVGALALVGVNFLGIHALSAATSAGFLVVFGAVNIAAIKLRRETGTAPWMPAIAFLLCAAALVIMMREFLSTPETHSSVVAVVVVICLAVAIELGFRLVYGAPKPEPAS